ncbi:MAG TPA: ABC transporter ATP-binding protein [Planctomycetota bacterium]|nr:ABC transporter ATP-binding protein [Planctomycetota bacterium]
MNEPLLSVTGIAAAYGPIAALHEVTLRVSPGEIVALIGGNGAGKTTTLACIAGLLRPTRGHIAFAGGDLAGVAPHRVVERGLALVPEGRRIFPKLSVCENLLLGAYTRRDRAAIADDVERSFALFPILRERASQAGGTLSGGEQQMLAIARALMSRPRLVCMDEPSMGVAPMLAAKIFAAIRQLNAEGLSVLLVEQNARMALKLAHRGYVIETGRTTLSDSAERLAADPRVQKAYLGECAV